MSIYENSLIVKTFDNQTKNQLLIKTFHMHNVDGAVRDRLCRQQTMQTEGRKKYRGYIKRLIYPRYYFCSSSIMIHP